MKTKCRAGIARLRELLEEEFKASKGFGAMYVLHSGWCSILLEEYEKLLDHIAFAREPSFSALSEHACELGLALWYEGKMDFAREYSKLHILSTSSGIGRALWPFDSFESSVSKSSTWRNRTGQLERYWMTLLNLKEKEVES
ncbi:MAG: hypothetical protein VYC82_04070, partial [Verrucomicrobiota bacterium]|nr:hypothetical protein [Verrucomicrobiota bacterium]